MEREGMVFYRSFYEAIKELPPEDFKKCASAILEYGLNRHGARKRRHRKNGIHNGQAADRQK